MKLTQQMLDTVYGRKIGKQWPFALAGAAAYFDINTKLRMAAFLAQVGHESGRLRYTREIWGPTPAQAKYEGRIDLGNTQPGDGHRYLGRGPIQITGRANYASVSQYFGIDYVATPGLAEDPYHGAMIAGWYWDSRKLNALADAGQFETITRRINGGLNGQADRVDLYNAALRVL